MVSRAILNGWPLVPPSRRAGVPINIVAPSISGTFTVGQVLTLSNGSWIGFPTLTYSFQWLRNGLPIDGATGSTYTLLDADAGALTSAVVVASNPYGNVSATTPASLTSGAGGGVPLDPLRNLILDHEWVVNPTGTFSGELVDGGHFLSDGSANTNVSKLLDAIPGATYSATYRAFRIGAVTPLVRCGNGRQASNYVNNSSLTLSAANYSASFVPTASPIYFGFGQGAATAEVDCRLIDIHQTIASLAIVAFGNSETAGANVTAAQAYPAVAATKFAPARMILNQGLGGFTSDQIAVKQGGKPLTITVTGDQIPATGAVAITAKNVNILMDSGNFMGSAVIVVAGVPGVITTDASGNWTLTRDKPGSIVSCPPNSVATLVFAKNVRSLTQWIMAGANDIGKSIDTAANDAAMVSFMGHQSFLIGCALPNTLDGDLTTAASIERVAKNQAKSAAYGSKYVNALAVLQAAGTGTGQDAIDVANGWTPTSLRSDNIHLNVAGYAIMAQLFYDKHVANGYP